MKVILTPRQEGKWDTFLSGIDPGLIAGIGMVGGLLFIVSMVKEDRKGSVFTMVLFFAFVFLGLFLFH